MIVGGVLVGLGRQDLLKVTRQEGIYNERADVEKLRNECDARQCNCNCKCGMSVGFLWSVEMC